MELSIEYIAGFFDGEGSVGVYPTPVKHGRYRTYRLTVSIGQVHGTVLRQLRERFGGALHFYERSKKLKNRQDAWYWYLSGRKAADFLIVLRPFLIAKAEQVDLAIEFQNQKLRPGHKYSDGEYRKRGASDPGAQYYEKLKAMKRGVPLH